MLFSLLTSFIILVSNDSTLLSNPNPNPTCYSVTQSCPMLCDPTDCSMPGLPVHHHLRELAQTHVHWVSGDIQPSHPLSSPSSPAFNFSQHQGLSQWISSSHQYPKYLSFSFNMSPSNSGLISFRIDWFDLLAVQGTFKSLLQHHSSKASVLWCSAFFMVQLSHPYITTEKTKALTIWTFVGKVISLLFNMLSRYVISFLPRSKHLLISWLQLPSAVILESKKIMSFTVFVVSLSICHKVMGPDAMILVFWMLSFKPAFSLDSFTIKRLFSSSLLSCHKGGVICISEVIDISPAILIPACVSSSLALLMMYSACKLSKQGDNIEPWCTPFPILNQSPHGHH